MSTLGPNRFVKEVGRTPERMSIAGEYSFCVVLGLFDEEGNQVVHKNDDGTETPVVWLSLPIKTTTTQTKRVTTVDNIKILQ